MNTVVLWQAELFKKEYMGHNQKAGRQADFPDEPKLMA